MNFKNLLISCFASIMMSFGLPKNIHKKVYKEIKKTFNIELFNLSSVKVPSDLVSTLPVKFEENNLFEITDNNERLGFAYVSKAPSKTDDFDYLVLFDSDLIIVKSKVLIYREDYGGEIGSKRWLKQFIGKTQNDKLRYGDNIAAISGATISVRSMTMAVNNLLASIKILHNKKLL